MTRQQRWAKAAFEKVKARSENAEDSKAYATICMKMPTLIKQAGVVQALHFANRNEKFQPYLEDLAAVAGEDWNAAGCDELCRRTRETQRLDEYIALTRDVGAVAQWFRRFAQSELKGDAVLTEDAE